MVKPPKGFQQRPYSLPRETGDMPRPVRVLDLLSPPADPEPKGVRSKIYMSLYII